MICGVKSWNVQLKEVVYDYNGLNFKKNSFGGYVMNGSLHKFFNNGKHNANDFRLTDIVDVYNQLFVEIGFEPDKTLLNGFEFGVNIKLPTNPNEVLNRLILHKKKVVNTNPSYKEFQHENYTFKIYNKSELTKIEPYNNADILRIELKVKMKHLKGKVHVKTFSDLIDIEVWKELENILVETINDCLIIDLSDTEIKTLTRKENDRLKDYVNPLFWAKFLIETKDKELNKKLSRKYLYNLTRCETLIKNRSKSTLKTDLIDLVKIKCTELRNISDNKEIVKSWCKLPVYSDSEKIENCNVLPIKIKEENKPISNPTEPDNVKRCKGCGRILTNPSKRQLFCTEKEVGESEAHKCRDMDSNPRNNAKRSYERIISIPVLFDFTDYIAPDKRKYL